VTATGDAADIGSAAICESDLESDCWNAGYADLFSLEFASAVPVSEAVSTRSEPGRPPPGEENPPACGVDGLSVLADTGVVTAAALATPCARLAEMRASSEEPSAESPVVLVLPDRSRWTLDISGELSPPGMDEPGAFGSWMKQQRLPYGHDPDTQKV
jgi:hypothetical protein